MSLNPFKDATGKDFAIGLGRFTEKYRLWIIGPLALGVLAVLANIALAIREAVTGRETAMTALFAVVFIYSLVIYYFVIYGLLSLWKRGAAAGWVKMKGPISLFLPLAVFGALSMLPPISGGSMVILTFPRYAVWMVPGFLAEVGVSRSIKDTCARFAGFSDRPGSETWDEIRAKGYRLRVETAALDARGGVIVRLEVRHPFHESISAGRFFRFHRNGVHDPAFRPLKEDESLLEVLPLADGRILYYQPFGDSLGVRASVADDGRSTRLRIAGVHELRELDDAGGGFVVGFDNRAIVLFRIPESPASGERLVAKKSYPAAPDLFPGYTAGNFILKPAGNGVIRYAVTMVGNGNAATSAIALVSFDKAGRLVSKKIVHRDPSIIDNPRCALDADGGLVYRAYLGDGVDTLERIGPDGGRDERFAERFRQSAGSFGNISLVKVGRDGTILVAGGAGDENSPRIVLLDKNGTKIAGLFGK